VLAPWVQESVKPLNLQTPAVVPATPAALILALLLGQVRQASAVRSAFATVLEPASEYGRGAMDGTASADGEPALLSEPAQGPV